VSNYTIHSPDHTTAILLSLVTRPPPGSPHFPYTTLFRSPVGSLPEREQAARDLLALGCRAVVVKGGHAEGAVDAFFDGERFCWRSEEHTSELQSRGHLVCRPLLAKKNSTSQPCVRRRVSL